jgi:hypothetical protein
MRLHRIMLVSAALLTPALAVAQSTPPPAKPPAGAGQAQTQPQTPRGFSGLVDFGVRGSSVDDDGARYERYRDLGDGAFMEVFRWNGQPGNWFLNLAADHVGRRDQRYTASVALPGRLKLWGQYDQIPMLLFPDAEPIEDWMNESKIDVIVPLKRLKEWIRRYEPEVIISKASFVLPRLAELKLQVPRNIAFVDVFLDTFDGWAAGVRQNHETVGELAVEILAGQLHHNKFGVPTIPTTTLIEGTWFDGASCPVPARR